MKQNKSTEKTQLQVGRSLISAMTIWTYNWNGQILYRSLQDLSKISLKLTFKRIKSLEKETKETHFKKVKSEQVWYQLSLNKASIKKI